MRCCNARCRSYSVAFISVMRPDKSSLMCAEYRTNNVTQRSANDKIYIFQAGISRSAKQKIHFDFDGRTISSNGGLLLMSQLDRKLGLTARIDKVLADFDGRQRGKVLHSALSMTRQLIFSLIAGHEDLNDHSKLGKDPFFRPRQDAMTPLLIPVRYAALRTTPPRKAMLRYPNCRSNSSWKVSPPRLMRGATSRLSASAGSRL